MSDCRPYWAGCSTRVATRIVLAAVVALAIGNRASTARADDAKRTLVIAAQADAGGADAEVVRAVRAALSDLEQVSLMAPAPLDLEAVQLALDCPDENAHCLKEVAERMKARVLIVPAVTRSGDETALRLLYFDAGAGAEPRAIVRRATGDGAERELQKKVPAMVRELFGVEEASELPAPTEAEAETQTAPAAATADRASQSGRPLPIGPVVLGGVGLGAMATGLIVGALMQKSENDYAERTITTEAEAMSAEVVRERGERQAVVANVLLGAGVTAVVAAGVWFALDWTSHDRPSQAALVPVIGPRSAGVSLLGTWEGTR